MSLPTLITSDAIPEGTLLLFSPPEKFVFVEDPNESPDAAYLRMIQEYLQAGSSAMIRNIGQ